MSLSQFKVIEYISGWKTIKIQTESYVVREIFKTGQENETSWKLYLYIEEKKTYGRNPQNYSLNCSVILFEGYPLTATCHIKVKLGEDMYRYSSSSHSLIKKNDVIKFPELLVLQFPHTNSIFIQCELEIFKINSTPLLYRKIESMNNVVADFIELLEDDNTKDISLISKEGKVVRAHKIILTARSEVFAAMFQHDMQENVTNRVEINDLEEELLNEMLRFIYSGDLSTWNYYLAKNMFVIGDRYKIKSLKDMCSSFLTHNLDIETVVEVLILADMHADGVLKNACKSFIEINSNDVLQTMGWNILLQKHTHLVNDVILSMTGNKSKIL